MLLGLGGAVYDDYGVGWDEDNNSVFGRITLDHILGRNQNAEYYKNPNEFWHPVTGQFARTHGPVVEVMLVGLALLLEDKDPRPQLLFRHLCIFLLFYVGVFFFYLVGKRVLSSWRLGLLGALFLVLSPRIFSHAFHNSMDISFLTVYIVCILTLLRYLERPTPLRAAVHGVACALLVDIRIAGLILPAITGAFLLMEVVVARAPKKKLATVALSFAVYLVVMCPLAVLLWPMLWGDPIRNLLVSFEVAANDPWSWWELYMGRIVYGTQVPWHFTPIWMLVTTPPLYALLFLVGLLRLLLATRISRSFYREQRGQLVSLSCLVLPLVAVAVMGSTLFNGWRHMYFVYPGFLVLALLGVRSATRRCRWLLSTARSARISRGVTYGAIICSVLATGRFMVHSHPHQISYFNLLVGGPSQARKWFQMGYWGTEYREGLIYLLRQHVRNNAPVTLYFTKVPAALSPINSNIMIINHELRGRIRATTNIAEADYFMTNFCNHVPLSTGDPNWTFDPIWSRKVEGTEILTIYRVRKTSGQ